MLTAHSHGMQRMTAPNRTGEIHVFCNGPFSLPLDILSHFVKCKQRHPVGTAALKIHSAPMAH
eukprot:5274604-Pyramimonas_sp.AAC.1